MKPYMVGIMYNLLGKAQLATPIDTYEVSSLWLNYSLIIIVGLKKHLYWKAFVELPMRGNLNINENVRQVQLRYWPIFCCLAITFFFIIASFYSWKNNNKQRYSFYICLIFRIEGIPNMSRRIAPRTSLGNVQKLSYILTCCSGWDTPTLDNASATVLASR